jgi:hypothetical protein
VILWIVGSGLWLRLSDTAGPQGFCVIFSKGEGDYLVIQEKIFKGMDLEGIYKRAKEHHHSSKE